MNEQARQSIERIVKAIKEHERFLIATHVRPDGDAIGSLLSLTFMLRKLGKRADPFCQDAVPPGQEFLAGSQDIRPEPPDPTFYEAAFLVDCGEFSRVGSRLEESIRQVPMIINIDHHVSKMSFGDISWVDSSASSTCEMLYDLSQHLPLPLDADIASQLYTGILTDTGSFRFSNTTQRVLEIATALVGAGAKPAFIAEQIYDSASPQRLRLLAQVLSTVAFYHDDHLATAELTQRMFIETSTSPLDSEGFINHLRSVKPVEMAMLFREEKDGLINVSLRSKGSTDVAAFAQKFNGGGHRNAAAFRTPGPLSLVRAQMTKEALSYLK